MDKDKAPAGGGLPPYPAYAQEFSRMPDCPPRGRGHRRARSEILGLPDDISFDSELGIVGGAADGPSLSDEADEEDLFSMYIDMDKFADSAASSGLQVGEATSSSFAAAGGFAGGVGVGERPRVRHQHSLSMDGSSSIKPEMLGGGGGAGMSVVEAKKALSAAKLADLALIDPKRAKRIWANRQSASRSKERKMRYIAELERKVQTLQTESTTLSAQLTLLQRDTTGLTAENSELKLRLQTMEQQVHLQDALNDALREEVQRLKLVTGQAMPNGAQMNYGSQYGGISQQQYYPQNNAMHTLMAAHQLQQLQIHSQQSPQQVLQNQHQNPQTHISNQFPHAHQQPTERIKVGSLASCSRETSADTSSLTTKE